MKDGGRVRTKTMSDGRYARICVDSMGKTHMGEIKEKQGSKMMSMLDKGK